MKSIRPLELLDAQAKIEKLKSRISKMRTRRVYLSYAKKVYRDNLILHGKVKTLERQIKRRDKKIAQLEAELGGPCEPLTTEQLKKSGITLGLDSNPFRYRLNKS